MAFSQLLKDMVINMEKKLMDTETKSEMDAAKIACKRVTQKAAEPTGDLIGYKIADKITSIGQPKEKEKKNQKK